MTSLHAPRLLRSPLSPTATTARWARLYQEVVSLIEPYNRAETNKDDTKEAADEASAIYKEIKSLLDELKGATDAYDAAKKTADTKDDEAANATLAAIVAKTSEYTAKIENLRTRITKARQGAHRLQRARGRLQCPGYSGRCYRGGYRQLRYL